MLALGVVVIATMSSTGKAKKLEDIGVQEVIIHQKDMNNGNNPKKMSTGGVDAHHIIYMGGEAS